MKSSRSWKPLQYNFLPGWYGKEKVEGEAQDQSVVFVALCVFFNITYAILKTLFFSNWKCLLIAKSWWVKVTTKSILHSVYIANISDGFSEAELQLIKYACDDPVTDFHILNIPEAVHQDKPVRFGLAVALNALSNLKSYF